MPNVADGQFEIKMNEVNGLELEKILKAGLTKNGSNVCYVNIHDAQLKEGYPEVMFDVTFTIRTAGEGSNKQTEGILRAMNIIPE